MMQNTVSAVYHISGWERILYTVIPILAVLGLLLTLGLSVYQSYRRVQKGKPKNSLPLVCVQASLRSKRMQSSSGKTTYFATFSIQDGQALELAVPESEYEKLLEGEMGELQHHGSHFVHFQTNTSYEP